MKIAISSNFQNGNFKKITSVMVAEVILIQVCFLTVGSNLKKEKINRRNSPCYLKLDLLKSRDSYFFLVWVMESRIMFGYKVKDFSKGFYKWIICIYKGVYNLLRAMFLLLCSVLSKCFFYRRVKIS